MSVSLSTGGRAPVGLKAFRLLDIPYPIRKRAATLALAQSDKALRDDQSGVGGLLARLTRAPADGVSERDAIVRAADRPSERVYWISREAWEKVMGG